MQELELDLVMNMKFVIPGIETSKQNTIAQWCISDSIFFSCNSSCLYNNVCLAVYLSIPKVLHTQLWFSFTEGQ